MITTMEIILKHILSLGNVDIGMQQNIITDRSKISFGSMRRFVPYATAQGIIAHGRLKRWVMRHMAEEDATTYFKDSALGFGALGALGLGLRTRPIAGKTQAIMFWY